MKLEAVVVTVVWVQEEDERRALARKVHITALHVNSSPPHSSRRGMWSWGEQHTHRTERAGQHTHTHRTERAGQHTHTHTHTHPASSH